MNDLEPLSEEIVVVGGKYGEYADVLNDLYDQNIPITLQEVRKALGGDQVTLAPASNGFVPYAVGVFNDKNERLGYVWMRQAPAIQAWMVMNQMGYVLGHITGLDHVSKSLKVEFTEPIQLPVVDRWKTLDFDWAQDIPRVHTPLSDPCLTLSVLRLRDELRSATAWTDSMQQLINNLLRALPTDLSEKLCDECVEVYHLMKRSQIPEIRQQADFVLRVLIKEEADEHFQWWMNEWLPGYFKEVKSAGVDKIFAASQYSISDIEKILDKAPYDLFKLYKAQPEVFPFRLYFSSLPQSIYHRLLTLLAVREAMIEEEERIESIADNYYQDSGPAKLRFFRDRCFRSIEGQESLKDLLKKILPRIDEESGRDWICLYMGYIFFKNKRIKLKKYVDFFDDIETLMPGVLTKIDETKSGYARYKMYVDTMTQECSKWFIDKGCLPPLNMWRSKSYIYQVDYMRQERIQLLTSEVVISLNFIYSHS